jgi:hypothetical protein
MTTPALLKRLNALTPPPRPASYQAPAPDPEALDRMRAYLAGTPMLEPGASDAVHQAMLDFLAGNGPPA